MDISIVQIKRSRPLPLLVLGHAPMKISWFIAHYVRAGVSSNQRDSTSQLSRSLLRRSPDILRLQASTSSSSTSEPVKSFDISPIPSPPPPSHIAPPLLSTPSTLPTFVLHYCGHVQAARYPRVHSRRPFFRLPDCPGSSFNSTQHNSSAAAHMAKTRLRH